MTTLAELDDAPAHGISILGDTTLLLSEVSYMFRVQLGTSVTTFASRANLRNNVR